MRVLLDTCVAAVVKRQLVAAGHDVVWMGDLDQDPGDEEILRLASEQDRILVTLDKDFGEMAVVHGKPHRGILRLVALSASRQAALCSQVLDSHGTELIAGAIVTATLTRLRVRLAPPEEEGEPSQE